MRTDQQARIPASRSISIEQEGKPYYGIYTVSEGTITVSNGEGTKTTPVGSMSVETLAKQLLSELVHEGKA
jgi:hypothetical protein